MPDSSYSSSCSLPSSMRCSTACLSRSSCSTRCAPSTARAASALSRFATSAHLFCVSSRRPRTTARSASSTSCSSARHARPWFATPASGPLPAASASAAVAASSSGRPSSSPSLSCSTAAWKARYPFDVRRSPLAKVRRCISASSVSRTRSISRATSAANRSHSPCVCRSCSPDSCAVRVPLATSSSAASFCRRTSSSRAAASCSRAAAFSSSASSLAFSSPSLPRSPSVSSSSRRSLCTSSATRRHSPTPRSSHSRITAFSSRSDATSSWLARSWRSSAAAASGSAAVRAAASSCWRCCIDMCMRTWSSSSCSCRFSRRSTSKWLLTCSIVRCRPPTCCLSSSLSRYPRPAAVDGGPAPPACDDPATDSTPLCGTDAAAAAAVP
eukprot:Rhum_TRINITY_DN14828_c4_g1::Rhum_TRINITY_DN14828_c4_g1_i1::g.123810::m.123810